MLVGLTGLSHLLAASLLATAAASPLEWSPNGRWLAYTITDADSTSILHDGWMTTAPVQSKTSTGLAVLHKGTKHRIWASRFGASESVLIEESRWPLSAPTWGADGRSLVFARFAASSSSNDADPSRARGRYEVVVQSGLDRKKAIVVLPELELEADQFAAIAGLKPEISPDGRYLALPLPGRTRALAIVRLDQGAVVKTIEGGLQPSWAPDGLRLLFVRTTEGPKGEPVRAAYVLNRDLGSAHPLKTDMLLLDSPPLWSLDGQSILALTRPPSQANGELRVDLSQISLDGEPTLRLMTLESVQRNRPAAPFGRRPPGAGPIVVPVIPRRDGPVTLVDGLVTLDHGQENCVALIELEGQPRALRWCDVASQRVAKFFHPLDLAIPIYDPAMSPDGRTIAFRVDLPGVPALPAFCDLASEAVTLVAPDGPTRRVWLELLASCSTDVLKMLPPPAADAGPPTRATILPPPNEIAGNNPQQLRLRHLAKIARGLLDQPPPAGVRDQRAWESASPPEIRLFFDYLGGDFQSASARLRDVEARAADPESRLRWLCLRAQVLIGLGEVERALGISQFINRETRPQAHTIEMTPAGPVISTIPARGSEWASALAQTLKSAELHRLHGRPGSSPGEGGEASEISEWDALNNQILDAQPISPFAPDEDNAPGAEGFERFRRRMQVVPPPRPRFAPPPPNPEPPGLPRL